ncbi:hypothetical protein [Bradyrhizobium sp. STM 3562]|uniref:hypothetical protein n=1 Tax=Bradyrhizobium sp. STM 3562 TaxID=578924 RepID=UPI00388E5538
MVKILAGLIAALVLAVAGYFGFESYLQHRVATEVEAAFEQFRSAGAKASHGKISYDPWKRTLAIANIASESTGQPPLSLKIATLTASGVGQPDAARISADLIEAAGVEISFAIILNGSQLQYTYKVPKLLLAGYASPRQPPQLPASASAIDLYRFAIAQFARVTASSVTVPSLSAVVKSSANIPFAGEFTYSGVAMQGIEDGKIATATVDKASLAYNTHTAGKTDRLTGTLANLTLHDLDATAAATVLDPEKANDDRSYRVYRQIATGAYDVTSQQGVHMHLDRIAVDDVEVRPSRLQLPALLAAIPAAGTTPPPAQAHEMMEKLAGLYEGLRVGNFEISGISIDTPQGPIKLSSLRLNIDNGRGDLGLEGLDARTPKGPLRAEHFALKSLDLAKLMRVSASLSNPPSGQALALFQVIGGAELKNFVAPYKDTNKQVSIDSFSFDWGQLVGPIPTEAHLAAKISTPVDASNPAALPLLAAGIDTVALGADLGAAWREPSGAFALEPMEVEIGGVLKASARLSLAHVPREVFTPDVQQAAALAEHIEAGAVELSLHDLGGVDLLVGQYARSQSVSREVARSAIMEAIKTNGEKAAAANPDAEGAVEAITRFIETPQQTLVLKLTPLGKVPALKLLQLLKTDPFVALAQFKIEASTGL